jgi:hypothetical protein
MCCCAFWSADGIGHTASEASVCRSYTVAANGRELQVHRCLPSACYISLHILLFSQTTVIHLINRWPVRCFFCCFKTVDSCRRSCQNDLQYLYFNAAKFREWRRCYIQYIHKLVWKYKTFTHLFLKFITNIFVVVTNWNIMLRLKYSVRQVGCQIFKTTARI